MTRRHRGRPTDRSPEQTRAAILSAAQVAFGASGYQRTSMEEIGAAAGVDARAISYHFGSKRGLFEAATSDAVTRFGDQVVTDVFRHDDVKSRLLGYLEVYRALSEDDPAVVPFLGVVLVDSRAQQTAGLLDAAELIDAGEMLEALIGSLVDDAIAAGEVTEDVTREGAVQLIRSIGMGLSLVARERPELLGETIDTLELLIEGRLFR